jgi:uncharacterized protein (DUF952 family)
VANIISGSEITSELRRVICRDSNTFLKFLDQGPIDTPKRIVPMIKTEPERTSRFVYKVLPAGDWQRALKGGAFAGSTDDTRDGFIHLSLAHQLAGTLAKYFRGQNDLLLVAFEATALGPRLKFEASRGGDLFPHLYGPLPTALALWHKPLGLGAGEVPVVNEEWL